MKKFAIAGLLLFAAISTSSCSVLIEKLLSGPTPTETPVPTPPSPPTQPALPTRANIPTTTPTTSAATPTTAASSGNPLDALTKSFRGWGSVKSFRAKLVTTGGTSATQEMNLEVVLPDRFHVSNKQIEMIAIGTSIYFKVGNQWQKVGQLSQAFDLTFADPKRLEKDLGVSTDVKFIGPELLDGTPTLVYQYTSAVANSPGEKYTAKVWIGVADNFPRKVEGTSAKGTKTTITYYDFNANITISPPIP